MKGIEHLSAGNGQQTAGRDLKNANLNCLSFVICPLISDL